MTLTLSRIEEPVCFDVPSTTSTSCECLMARNVGRKLKNDRFPGAVWRHSGAELDLFLYSPWSDSRAQTVTAQKPRPHSHPYTGDPVPKHKHNSTWTCNSRNRQQQTSDGRQHTLAAPGGVGQRGARVGSTHPLWQSRPARSQRRDAHLDGKARGDVSCTGVSRCTAADQSVSQFFGGLSPEEAEEPRWTVDALGQTSPMSHDNASNAKSCQSSQSAAAFMAHAMSRN